MAKFIAFVSYEGLIPDGIADRPGPDPAMFGLPIDDDGARNDALLQHNKVSCTHYRHDLGALRAAWTRVVLGVGAESAQQLAGRGAPAVADRLDTTAVQFPGGHYGFLSAPAAFAATLRGILD
jgi:hypothetical protein